MRVFNRFCQIFNLAAGSPGNDGRQIHQINLVMLGQCEIRSGIDNCCTLFFQRFGRAGDAGGNFISQSDNRGRPATARPQIFGFVRVLRQGELQGGGFLPLKAHSEVKGQLNIITLRASGPTTLRALSVNAPWTGGTWPRAGIMP